MLSNCCKNYLFTVITAIVITLLSLLPVSVPEIAKDVPLFDKWAHFVMYGFLTLVIWTEYSINERTHGTKKAAWWLLIFGCILPALFGGLLEIAQATITTTRSGEWLDFYADSIGAVLGAILGYIVKTQIILRK